MGEWRGGCPGQTKVEGGTEAHSPQRTESQTTRDQTGRCSSYVPPPPQDGEDEAAKIQRGWTACSGSKRPQALSPGQESPQKVSTPLPVRSPRKHPTPDFFLFPEAPQEHDPFTYGEGGGASTLGSWEGGWPGVARADLTPLLALSLTQCLYLSLSFSLSLVSQRSLTPCFHLPLSVSPCVYSISPCLSDSPSPFTSHILWLILCFAFSLSPLCSPHPLHHPPLLSGFLPPPCPAYLFLSLPTFSPPRPLSSSSHSGCLLPPP